MSKIKCLVVAVLFCSTTAFAATVVELNTGFRHSTFAPYPTVTSTISGTQDQYWINIASFPPTNPVAPTGAWVLRYPGSPWQPSMPATHWIGPRKTVASDPTTSASNPAYTIFRKCFCLLPNFTQPSLSFRLRADDTVQAWFNTQLNVLVPPSPGNFSGNPLSSAPSNPAWFRVGRNCLYVLVEDTGGWMGFDLLGTIQANGLMPIPASGAAAEFPCPCASGTGGTPTTQASDAAVVTAIRKIAEQRRLERIRSAPQQ